MREEGEGFLYPAALNSLDIQMNLLFKPNLEVFSVKIAPPQKK